METPNGTSLPPEATQNTYPTRRVFISDAPDCVLQVVIRFPSPQHTNSGQRRIHSVTEYELSSAKLVPYSPWIKDQLGDLATQPDRPVIWLDHGEHVSRVSVEIILRALHGSVEESSYGVDLSEMWHLAWAAGQLDISTRTPALVQWFDEWYARRETQLDPNLAKQYLYPCWAFGSVEGFQRITGYLAYNAFGYIYDSNPCPARYPHLRTLRVDEHLIRKPVCYPFRSIN